MGRRRAETGAESESNAGGPGGAASGPLGIPAPPIRRSEAFACGRLFQETRVAVCELALNPRVSLEDRLVRGIVPRLLAAAAATSPGAERDLELWLHDLRQEVCGQDYVEELAALQRDLNNMTLYERQEHDLIAMRARQLRPYHEAFDRRRAEVCRGLVGPVAEAFRLGELIESGARPDAWLLPANAEGEPEVPAPVVLGYGQVSAVDYDARDRLVLSPPLRHPFDYPWHLSWPARVGAQWRATGLSEPPEGVLPRADGHPPGPDRRRAVFDNLVATASRVLGERYTPRVEVRDRLRIIDVGARIVKLDGREIPFQHQRSFLVLRALLDAPSCQLTTAELQRIPGCLNIEVCKVLAQLPPELAGVIRSTGGPEALYHIVLQPLPAVEG